VSIILVLLLECRSKWGWVENSLCHKQ
jgi:hypothetical protein